MMKADLYNPRKSPSFKCAYHHRIGPPAGETPPEKVEAAVIAIVEKWNTLIPSRKVRILNDVRFDMVRAALRQFTEADIIQTIAFYSKQPWQKKNQWQLFDNFFFAPPPRNAPLLNWWEQAVSAAEKTEEKRPPVKQVRELAAKIGERVKSDSTGWPLIKQRFFALPDQKRIDAICCATDKLRKCRPSATFTENEILRQALQDFQAKGK